MAYGQSGRIVLSSRLLATKSSNRRHENNDPYHKQLLISKPVATPTSESRSETLRNNEYGLSEFPRLAQPSIRSACLNMLGTRPDLSPGPVPFFETPRPAAQPTEAFSLRAELAGPTA